jgi:hypothetical protein
LGARKSAEIEMMNNAQEDPYTLIKQVENAKSHEESESLTNALVNLGERAVEALIEKMPKLVTAGLHIIGLRVFARVGYPANSKALDYLVSDVSNINSLSYETSLDALLKIGAPALPVIENALDFYRHQDAEGNILEIDSLEALKEQIIKQ